MEKATLTTAGIRREEWFVENKYLEKHPTWFIHEAPWKADHVLRMMRRNGLDPQSIIDVGCGAGGVLAAMQPQLRSDCVLQGFDIAPAAIAMASERANERLCFEVGDATTKPDLRADLILVLDVLDHLEDNFSFLRAIKPMSRHKIIHMSLNISVQKVLRGNALLFRRQTFSEIHYYTKDLALQLFRDLGYNVLDYFYTGMAIDMNDARGRLMDGGGNPSFHLRNLALRGPRRLLFRINPDFAVRLLGGYHLMILVE